MLAWRVYQGSLHSCGHPVATALHPDNEGWFEKVGEVTCWACTAAAEKNDDGTQRPVSFPIVVDTRDYAADPLPPTPITRT